MLANTIWSPLIIYHFGDFAVWLGIAVGFVAEFAAFRYYTRAYATIRRTLISLAGANFASYIAGHFVFIFLPVLPDGIHKDSLSDLSLGFTVAFFTSVVIEYLVLIPLIRAPRSTLFRAVCMGNFYSYAILFTAYILWFFGWRYLLRAITEST